MFLRGGYHVITVMLTLSNNFSPQGLQINRYVKDYDSPTSASALKFPKSPMSTKLYCMVGRSQVSSH